MIHRRSLIVLLFISIAFLVFFGHMYTVWLQSDASISEFPQPHVFLPSSSGQQNVSEYFNLYGSSVGLTEYSNITFKVPFDVSNNSTITTVFNVQILRETGPGSQVVMFNLTYQGNYTLNSTTIDLSPGNYLLMSSLSILVNSGNNTTAAEASLYIASTLGGTAFVNLDLNSYPYLIAVPTYFFITSTVVLMIVTYFFFGNDYDVRRE